MWELPSDFEFSKHARVFGYRDGFCVAHDDVVGGKVQQGIKGCTRCRVVLQ